MANKPSKRAALRPTRAQSLSGLLTDVRAPFPSPCPPYRHGEGHRPWTTTPTASLDDEWLSVNAAARRLGVTPTAIRNRIKRGTLEVRNGNFGKLVRVPLTVPTTVTLAPEEPVRETVILTPEERVSLTVTLTVLRDHIAWLKDSLAKAEGELEGSRGRAAQLAGLEAQGEALHKAAKLLRAQADEVRVDRDHWREQAQQLALRLSEQQMVQVPNPRRWWRRRSGLSLPVLTSR